MSVFLERAPEVAYRFHVQRPNRDGGQVVYDLAAVWHHGADRLTWVVRCGILNLAECDTASAAEPMVRAWFLGDCIPGIVADFIEERGEGTEWLLRLLRDDPDWHASVPRPEFIVIDDPAFLF